MVVDIETRVSYLGKGYPQLAICTRVPWDHKIHTEEPKEQDKLLVAVLMSHKASMGRLIYEQNAHGAKLGKHRQHI